MPSSSKEKHASTTKNGELNLARGYGYQPPTPLWGMQHQERLRLWSDLPLNGIVLPKPSGALENFETVEAPVCSRECMHEVGGIWLLHCSFVDLFFFSNIWRSLRKYFRPLKHGSPHSTWHNSQLWYSALEYWQAQASRAGANEPRMVAPPTTSLRISRHAPCSAMRHFIKKLVLSQLFPWLIKVVSL